MRSAHSEVVDSIEGTDGALSIPLHGLTYSSLWSIWHLWRLLSFLFYSLPFPVMGLSLLTPFGRLSWPRERTSKTWTMALERIHPWLKSSIPHSLTHTRQPNNRVYNKVSQFWIRKEAKNSMAGPGELLEWTQPDVQGVQSTVESALRELIELGWPERTWNLPIVCSLLKAAVSSPERTM